jgi:hypothetical protein
MKTKQKTTLGSALILTTILLFVILGMVVSLTYVTVMEQKMSGKTKSSVGSFYNAESGVEWILNKIASSSGEIGDNLTLNSDSSISCPPSFGDDYCKVYLLDQNGDVIQDSSVQLSDVKAVRSVGSQGGETQRAIEAAVAIGSDYSYTYFCYNIDNERWGGTPKCVDSGSVSQGYCPSGETQKKELGEWGACVCSGPNYIFSFMPPSGGCWTTVACPSGGSPSKVVQGKAFVCSK